MAVSWMASLTCQKVSRVSKKDFTLCFVCQSFGNPTKFIFHILKAAICQKFFLNPSKHWQQQDIEEIESWFEKKIIIKKPSCNPRFLYQY